MSSGSVLLLTVLLMGYIYWSLAQPTHLEEIRCKIRRIPDISNCRYGTFVDPCGQYSCSGGPGDLCAKLDPGIVRTSRCADGLQCCDGKCRGCLKGKCFHEVCNLSSENLRYQHRSDPYMQERYIDPIWALFADYYSNQ